MNCSDELVTIQKKLLKLKFVMQQEDEKIVDFLKRTYHRGGHYSFLHIIFLKILNTFFDFRIFSALLKRKILFSGQNLEEYFERRFFTQDEIMNYFGIGFNGITSEKAKKLILQKIIFLCVLEKVTGKIAAYSCFSTDAMTTCYQNLFINFNHKYTCTLKVQTDPEFQGKNLHAGQMQYALSQNQRNSYLGILGYTYSDNSDSIKSNAKMGSESISRFWVFKILNQVLDFKCGQFQKYNVSLQKRSYEYPN